MVWHAYWHSLHTRGACVHTQATHQAGALAAALIHKAVLLPSVSCATTCIGCQHLRIHSLSASYILEYIECAHISSNTYHFMTLYIAHHAHAGVATLSLQAECLERQL